MGYSVQKLNSQLVNLLTPMFLRRREFYENGSRLWNALFSLLAPVGGICKYCWPVTNKMLYTSDVASVFPAATTLQHSSFFIVPDRGGPFAEFTGIDFQGWLDAAWQEMPGDGFCVWAWVRLDDLTNDMYAVAKWDYGNDRRSYCLRWNTTTNALEFAISTDGTAATEVAAASTHTVSVGPWYFCAGYARDGLAEDWGVAVGAATDPDLTFDTGGLFPGQPMQGDEPLLVGCAWNAFAQAAFWDGGIGILKARETNYSAADQRIYLRRVFHETRWHYEL